MHPLIALIRRGNRSAPITPTPISHPLVTLARRSALRSSTSRHALQSAFALRSEADLRKYQRHTVDLISRTLEPNGPPGVIMALEPGAGKTVSTLTAIRKLLDARKIKKVLIVAPLLVARTVWHSEITQWLHTQGTTYSIVVGDAKQRAAKAAERTEVHIINKETVPWLWEHFGKGKDWPYDFLVIDEASMLKNGKKRTAKHKLTRFGTLAQARKHFKSVVELTGTPAPNGLVNLWGLAYIVDQGERLGRTKKAFLDRWFDQNQYTYEITPKPGAEKEIMDRIKDIMFSLDPKDYVELPPLVENNIKVQLPPKIMAEYRRFKRTLISEMYDVEAVNAAVLTNKLVQFANGGLWNEDGVVQWVHDLKLDALENLHDEVNGTPMLVAYNFIFDKQRIKQRFPKAVILNEVDDVMKTVDRWNAGGIDMLLAHRASAGHGLNLQKGSNIFVSYGLTADLELWQQFNKRLWRSGQIADRVWHHRIIAEGTHDEEILPILDRKDAVQSMVLRATMIDLSKSEA